MSIVVRGTGVELLARATCDELAGAIEPGRRQGRAEIFLKVTSKQDPGGDAVLKIKGSVLFEHAGKVTVKAKYLGTLETAELPEIEVCSHP